MHGRKRTMEDPAEFPEHVDNILYPLKIQSTHGAMQTIAPTMAPHAIFSDHFHTLGQMVLGNDGNADDFLSSAPHTQTQANIAAFERDLPSDNANLELAMFAHSSNDIPYAPFILNGHPNHYSSSINRRFSGPAPGQMPNPMLVQNPGTALHNPADMGRAQSDSGYFTQDVKSSATQSVFSDAMYPPPGPSSIADGISGLDFHQNDPTFGLFSFGTFPPDFFNPPEDHDRPPYKCPECGANAKNKSERKKHWLRHQKPFKCQEHGCSRIGKGFSTQNDLDRHKKSVHRIAPCSVNDRTYRCAMEHCPKKEKIWPRADNFRQHCNRLHPGITLAGTNGLLIRSSMEHRKGATRGPSSFMSNDLEISGTSALPADLTQHGSLSDSATPGNLIQRSTLGGTLIEPASDTSSSVNNLQKVLCESPHTHQYQYDPLESQGSTFTGRVGSQGLNSTMMDTRSDSSEASGSPSSDGENPSQSLLSPSAFPSPAPVDGDVPNMQNPNDESRMLSDSVPMETSTPCQGDDLTKESSELVSKFEKLRQVLQNPDILKRVGADSLNDLDDILRAGIHKRSDDGAAFQNGRPASREGSTRSGLHERTPKQRARVKCSECLKVLYSQSDLNKHLKRHTRPYACTRDSCKSNFGSKNDWKRHELLLHGPLPEAYRCSLPATVGASFRVPTNVNAAISPFFPSTDPPTTISPMLAFSAGTTPQSLTPMMCTEVSYTKQEFYKHLSDAHEITDKPRRKEIKHKGHIGRNGQNYFWCGFCRDLISVGNKRDVQASDARFTHIDHCHFEKSDPRKWIELGQEETGGNSDRIRGDVVKEDITQRNMPKVSVNKRSRLGKSNKSTGSFISGGDNGRVENVDPIDTDMSEIAGSSALPQNPEPDLSGEMGMENVEESILDGGTQLHLDMGEPVRKGSTSTEKEGQDASRKKSRKKGRMWFCCTCGDGPMDLYATKECLYIGGPLVCTHRICGACTIEGYESQNSPSSSSTRAPTTNPPPAEPPPSPSPSIYSTSTSTPRPSSSLSLSHAPNKRTLSLVPPAYETASQQGSGKRSRLSRSGGES